jgi:hypothetical protein
MAPPTDVPFSVKLIVIPLIGALFDVLSSVADRFVVPPKVPVAAETFNVVAAAASTT